MNTAQLRRAYKAAIYDVETTDGRLGLRYGNCSPAQKTRLAALGIRLRWAVVTPCNPYSRQLSASRNRQRLRVFHTALERHGWRWHASINRDPEGRWPDEPGALLCDVPHAAVMCLAADYGQYAVLTAALGHAPYLAWTSVGKH